MRVGCNAIQGFWKTFAAVSVLSTSWILGGAAFAVDRYGMGETEGGPVAETHRAMPRGVIGLSLHVGAERVGDPAVLYVAHVHPEGPAHRAGLAHGDEILSVEGTSVTGKTYEQVVMMIRGDIGATVRVQVRGDGGVRDVAMTRVASDSLYKDERGGMGSHENPNR